MKPVLVERYRTRLPNSINNHSVKVFRYKGKRFALNRTTDARPMFFELYLLPTVPFGGWAVCPTIEVDGKRCWGDGLSWPKAEKIAFEAIKERLG